MKTTTSEQVEFSCHAPTAKAVFVAGTFNDWKPDAAPLQLHKSAGQWTGKLSLPPGRHEFKFVIDGQWCCEAACEHAYQGCPKCVPNEFGTMNRVLEVS
jgi:1,4-alpha-glucan branching enzyme